MTEIICNFTSRLQPARVGVNICMSNLYSKHNTMKNHVKELTEGMQRLCAVANRIVAQKGQASRIEVDLLLDDLRRLYDVALQLGGDELPKAVEAAEPSAPAAERPAEGQPALPPVKDEEHMMAMMATMAALSPAEPTEAPAAPAAEVPAPAAAPAAEAELPLMPPMEELEHSDNALLFDEIVIEEAPAPAPEPEPAPEPVAAVEPEPVVEPEPEPVAAVEPAPVAAPEPEPAVEPAPEPAVAPAPEPAAPAAPTQQASLLDYLSVPAQRTLGESLGEGRAMQHSLEKKVDDLRTVININDKFSFMSELFHNNMKAYNDFILRLNATASREEALAHVHDVAAQYKWDNDSVTVKSFYKIFDKKF